MSELKAKDTKLECLGGVCNGLEWKSDSMIQKKQKNKLENF